MEASMWMSVIIIMQSGILKRYIKPMIFKCLSSLCQEFSVLGERKKKKIARKAKRFKPERKAANIFLRLFWVTGGQSQSYRVASENHAPKRKFQTRKLKLILRKQKKSRKIGGKWIKNTSKKGYIKIPEWLFLQTMSPKKIQTLACKKKKRQEIASGK